MNILKKLFPFIVILIFSFFTYKPLLNPGFFPIHDDTQVARVYEMAKALSDGMFPVRWVSDLGYGYGYPIFNFYSPLPYYVGGFLDLSGLDSLNATKLTMFLGIILSGFSMYLFAKELWGKRGGLLASVFYIYAPYHAVEVYVRGDIAEFWAYSFIPLIFYAAFKIYKEQKLFYVFLFALSYAAIITSHNLTAMMITPFIIFFMLYFLVKKVKRKKTSVLFFSSFVLGICLSAFYSIPVFLEMSYTNVLSQVGGGANFRDHFVCLNQFWTSTWGYGGSARGCFDGVSFMVGKYHIFFSLLIFTLSLVAIFGKKYLDILRKEKEKVFLIPLFVFFFVFSLFLMLDLSRPIWEILKPMEFLQYPWRFLIISSFSSSVIVGSSFFILDKFLKNKTFGFLLYLTIIIFIVLVSAKFFVPQIILSKTAEDYTSSYNLKWITSKISDEYMPGDFQKPKSFEEVADWNKFDPQSLEITNLYQKTGEISLNVDAKKDLNVILPLAYYPSWKAYVNGKNVNLVPSSKGVYLNLTKGVSEVKLTFGQTPVQKLSNLVSIAGVLILIAGIIRLKPKYE